MKYPDDRRLGLQSRNICIVVLLALVVGAAVLNRNQTSASVENHAAAAGAEIPEDITETVTLTGPSLSTSQWNTTWSGAGDTPCRDVAQLPIQKPPAGQVISGYIFSHDHHFGYFDDCEEERVAYFNAEIYFDLSKIEEKAPAPGVFVTKATLNFKQIDSVHRSGSTRLLTPCGQQLLIATADWRSGYTEYLVPGADAVPISCGAATSVDGELRADCSVDVRSTVNNWVAGRQDNFGFVMKGTAEEKAAKDMPHYDSACQTRYGDFSLTVTYKYAKPERPGRVQPPAKDTPIILVAPGVAGRKNVALAANGGTAKVSSIYRAGFDQIAANNGDRRGIHAGTGADTGSFWAGEPSFPQWLEVDFDKQRTISEIDLFTVQDDFASPLEPTESMTFSKYGLTSFQVLYWTSSGWMVVPGGNVATSPNNHVWRKFSFSPAIVTGKIKVITLGSPDGFSRIAELEAWSP